MRRLLVIAILALLSAFPVLGQERESAPEPRFEVLVVGTLHAPWQFRSRAFHPGHVRAALEAAKPDVVGVESNPIWFAEGRFHDVTFEAQGIAVPWARAKGLPVYGIDWMDVSAWEERTTARQKVWASRLRRADSEDRLGGWAFGQVDPSRLGRLREYFENDDFSFRRMNDIDSDAYGKKWGRGDPKKPTFGGHRNREIVARCVEVMKKHPGRRLVVVIGAGHKAVLDALFRERPDVRLLSFGKDVTPPTEAEAKAALTDRDRIVILGHNLDGERSYFHPELIDLDWMNEILDQLSSYRADHRITVYFRARLYGHRRSVMSARVLLERLVSKKIVTPEEPPPLYPFPLSHWRMEYDVEQAARLELARLLLEGDGNPEARPMLEALAREMPEPPPGSAPEWKSAWLARRFPGWCMAPPRPPAPPSPESHDPGKLRDPGFEAGGEAWEVRDPNGRPLAVEAVEDGPAEGKRCLKLELREGQAKGPGFPCVGQSVRMTGDAAEWTFSIALRGRGVPSARMVVYVFPEPNRAKLIAEFAVDEIEASWARHQVRFRAPGKGERIRINLYVGRAVGGVLWLDDARLEPAE